MFDVVGALQKSAYSLTSVTGRGGSRYYLHGPSGAKLQSVTTYLNVINKPGLMVWKENLTHEAWKVAMGMDPENPERIARGILKGSSQAAARYGNALHHYIEYELNYAINGTLIDFQDSGEFEIDALREIAHKFVDWLAERGLTPLLSECPVANLETGYAGTIDLVAMDDKGCLYVVDIKTGKNIYAEHFYQLAAYRRAILELTDDYEIKCLAVKVREDGIAAYCDPDPDASYVAFNCAVALKDSLGYTNKLLKEVEW